MDNITDFKVRELFDDLILDESWESDAEVRKKLSESYFMLLPEL